MQRAWTVFSLALPQLPWALVLWAFIGSKYDLSTGGGIAVGLAIGTGLGIMLFLGRASLAKRPYFWSLGPYLLGFMAILPFAIPEYTVPRAILVVGLSGTALAFFLALANPERFWWGFRVVAAAVFLGYVAYAVDMIFIEKAPVRFGEPHSAVSPVNALHGLWAFGIPSLLFLFGGRNRVFSMMAGKRPPEAGDED